LSAESAELRQFFANVPPLPSPTTKRKGPIAAYGWCGSVRPVPGGFDPYPAPGLPMAVVMRGSFVARNARVVNRSRHRRPQNRYPAAHSALGGAMERRKGV
jgi:hypothetical protein